MICTNMVATLMTRKIEPPMKRCNIRSGSSARKSIDKRKAFNVRRTVLQYSAWIGELLERCEVLWGPYSSLILF